TIAPGESRNLLVPHLDRGADRMRERDDGCGLGTDQLVVEFDAVGLDLRHAQAFPEAMATRARSVAAAAAATAGSRLRAPAIKGRSEASFAQARAAARSEIPLARTASAAFATNSCAASRPTRSVS